MRQLAFVSSLTAILAVAGFSIGLAIHGATAFAIVPATAGGLGGFGMGCAILDVLRRWRRVEAMPIS
jgi:hypothetical protein